MHGSCGWVANPLFFSSTGGVAALWVMAVRIFDVRSVFYTCYCDAARVGGWVGRCGAVRAAAAVVLLL